MIKSIIDQMGYRSKGKKLFIYADVETSLESAERLIWEDFPTLDLKTRKKILATYDVIPWLLCYRFNGKTFHSFYPHRAFIDCLAALCKNRYDPHLVFHNASYDLSALIEPVFRYWDPGAFVGFQCKDSNGDFIKGSLNSVALGIRCRFCDSMQFKRISLKNAAKLVTTKEKEIAKTSMPYNLCHLNYEGENIYFFRYDRGKWETYPIADAIKYCANDVLITELYWNYIFKQCEYLRGLFDIDEKTFKKAKTEAGVSKLLADAYHRQHAERKGYAELYRYEIPVDQKQEYQIQNNSASGGFTTRNNLFTSVICLPTQQIRTYDVNSMYPFIMGQGVPVGPHLLECPPGKKCVCWYLVECSEIAWKPAYAWNYTPPIPKKFFDEKSRQPFYVTAEFLEVLNKTTTNNIRIIRKTFQVISTIYKEFNDRIYEERQKVKKQMEGLDPHGREFETLKMQDNSLKIVLNSGYGKMIEKVHEVQEWYIHGDYHKVEEPAKKYNYCLSGVYVAMAGRTMLLKKIIEVVEAGGTVLYADTDSVKILIDKKDLPKFQKLFINTGKLGEWKDEGTYDEYHSLGVCKKYLFINNEKRKVSCALSGVSRSYQEKLIKDYEQGKNEIIRVVYDARNNVLFKGNKTISILSHKWKQPIILENDLSTMSLKNEITHTIELDDKGEIVLTHVTE